MQRAFETRRVPVVAVLTVCGLLQEAAFAAQSPQVPLAGSAIPQFVQPLPLLSVQPGGTVTTLLGNQALTIRMCEFWANVLPAGTLAVGVQPKTRVWGYIPGTECPPNGPDDSALDTYLGPVIVNTRGSSTDVTWINNLGSAATTQVLAYKYSTDQTLHWADPANAEANECQMAEGFPAYLSACAQNYSGPIPAVVHLHGAEVPPEIDGGPDSWFTSDGQFRGHAYYSFLGAPANGALYKYPNTQEAAPVWFHDHVLGATRLNVYAGLAGAYYIEDPTLLAPPASTTTGAPGTCVTNCLPPNLQPIAKVVPVIIQDRMFDTNGQLFFPADSAANVLWSPNPEHAYWVPEFVGDAIVVNGKAWPYLDVEAKRYRFLFVNGSNARTYQMSIPGGPVMYVISTDGGYLDTPVALRTLVMQPGERYEVIIDFASLTGKRLTLTNIGRTPFPRGAPPNGSTLGRILQFRIGAAPAVADASYDPALGTPLRTGPRAITRLADPLTGKLNATAQQTRALSLNEVMGLPATQINPVTGVLTAFPGGPLEVLVNNTGYSGTDRSDFQGVTVGGNTTYYSEIPEEGSLELWEIINLTADAHPIHLHLAQFQLLNRQSFQVAKYLKAYDAAFGGTAAPEPLPAGCLAGAFCAGYGPPLNYAASTASGGKLGGNPDVTPWLNGPLAPPDPNEAGWKDTVISYPGMVTRLAIRWAPTDLPIDAPPEQKYFLFDPSDDTGHGYVWHCHIIDHEDNEMMRPDTLTLNPAAPERAQRPLRPGFEY